MCTKDIEVRARALGLVQTTTIPFTEAPFAVPNVEVADGLAPLFGDLVLAIATNHKWLRSTLGDVADPHVRFLLATMRPQTHRVAILRSDYLHDASANRLLQVELNTMSCAFPALATRVSELHGDPSNRPVEVVADALADAARAVEDGALVVMVVRPVEPNLHDQTLLLETLSERRGVTCVRRTLEELHRDGVFSPDHSQFYLRRATSSCPTTKRVGVVYFRACYDADETLGMPWAETLRARLEAAQGTIKCPSMDVQLAGTKKVQQVLAQAGVLEGFVEREAATRVRATFAGQWAADALPPAVQARLASDPTGFVLKPQTEGGGHNVHGASIPGFLASCDELSCYVLMERISPAPSPTTICGKGVVPEAVGELGVFSVLRTDRGRPVLNRRAGRVLRVKPATEPEGGICCGAAALSSTADGGAVSSRAEKICAAYNNDPSCPQTMSASPPPPLALTSPTPSFEVDMECVDVLRFREVNGPGTRPAYGFFDMSDEEKQAYATSHMFTYMTPTRATVVDRRANPATLACDAFELVSAPTTLHRDDLDKKESIDRYLDETTAHMKRVLGATVVLPFDYVLRTGEAWGADEFVKRGTYCCNRPHNDHTFASARNRIHDLLPAPYDTQFEGKRYAIVNAWRRWDEGNAWPLACATFATVDRDADLVACDLVYKHRCGHTFNIDSRANIEYGYYSNMSKDELLIFKIYDTEEPSFCIHTGVQNSLCPDDPPRVSIEARFIVLWDDHAANLDASSIPLAHNIVTKGFASFGPGAKT